VKQSANVSCIAQPAYHGTFSVLPLSATNRRSASHLRMKLEMHTQMVGRVQAGSSNLDCVPLLLQTESDEKGTGGRWAVLARPPMLSKATFTVGRSGRYLMSLTVLCLAVKNQEAPLLRAGNVESRRGEEPPTSYRPADRDDDSHGSRMPERRTVLNRTWSDNRVYP
jgi:hypothetical protein